ncbi:MAG: cytochrome ubiquinol oxidase subunit I [Myxococcaceae bacterium]
MDLLHYARAQMGLSLAFHIVFAAVGVGLPVLLFISDALYLRTKDPDYLELSKRLAKGTSILFAVGAVSGTVLSFELGLLWPNFMALFGEVIGIPFSLEGFAFFTEAIFLGIYLYGRSRISPRLHLFSAAVVAISGAASAFFVTLVNAFMNNPRGFELRGGVLTNIDPIAAMWSPSWATQTVHVLISSYQATAWAMVGIHAFMLLRYPSSTFHRKALKVALPVAVITALIQPLSGDRSAKHIAEHQPWKLAAAEAHFETSRDVPLYVGGLPDPDARTVRYGIAIPYGLSFLAFGDLHSEVKGLDQVPREDWPNVRNAHFAFQTMVGAGTAMAAIAVVLIFFAVRRKQLSQWLLKLLVVAAPLGFIALEAGWLLTEFGRQPWIVRGAMRTSEAMTKVPDLASPFWIFTLVYLLLGAVVVSILVQQVRATAPFDSGERA